MTKVNFENGFPVNWTMKDMDVVEMDKDVGHVLIPSILNGVPQLGQFSTHFDIADKGTFQLDLKLKIQHFNSSLSLEDNPYLQILLLRNISLETSSIVQAESSTASSMTTVVEKEGMLFAYILSCLFTIVSCLFAIVSCLCTIVSCLCTIVSCLCIIVSCLCTLSAVCV